MAVNKQGLALYAKGQFLEARRLFELALGMSVSAAEIKTIRQNIADTHQQMGNLAHKRGDQAQALREYELANQYRPGNAQISQSLTYLRGEIATQRQAKEMEAAAAKEARAAGERVQKSIQDLARAFNAEPASGGLDFDGRMSGAASGGNSSGGLDFVAGLAPNKSAPTSASPTGDPRVVDARNVPSGLSKATENAIAGAYQNAPPGVSDRVRKGFQATMDRDWNVAKAWFEDALNRDPGNAGLKRLVVLSDYTLNSRQAAAPAAAAKLPEVPAATPGKAAIETFFRDFQAGRRHTPTDEVRSYVLSLPPEQFKRLVWNLQPQDSDIEYLFELNTPRPARN